MTETIRHISLFSMTCDILKKIFKSMRTVITYGTFDLFHVGHVKLLSRAKELGDKLIVGVSSNEFNNLKGKNSIFPYEHRAEIVSSLKVVDQVIPEHNWEQKIDDIKRYNVDTFVMGHDWEGKFDELKEFCNVVYLPRTDGVSTTSLKKSLSAWNAQMEESLHASLDALRLIANQLGS